MFFAPAIRGNALLPEPEMLDFGFERFMNDAFRGTGCRMEEDDQSWTLSIDVPGVAREHLSVTVEGSTVRVETAAEARRQYKARYELPGELNVEASQATLQDGVLALKLAKAKPTTSRQITVQ